MEAIKINSKYFKAFLKGESSYDSNGEEYHIKLTNSEQVGRSSNGNKYFYVYGYNMIDGRKYITDWTTNKNNKLLDNFLYFYEVNDKSEELKDLEEFLNYHKNSYFPEQLKIGVWYNSTYT